MSVARAVERRIDLDDASWIDVDDAWLAPDEAARRFDELRATLAWTQKSVVLFGKAVPQPRLTAWYGDPGATYTYSGLTNDPLPWTDGLRALRDRAAADAGVPFNSVLANLYRDGNDSMGMHADDEPELGPAPVIASVSLGAPRRFVLKPKRGGGRVMSLALGDGSLIVMRGETQHRWRHGVPKEPRVAGARINLTFRAIVAPRG